jgi:Trypsin-like peptidase domain
MNKTKIALLITVYCLAISKAVAQQIKTDSTVKSILAKHQVLLTNFAVFKDHKDEMAGASAFLINYKNSTYAVTAKHLLGEAMGIEPEVKPVQLQQQLVSWKLFPRVPVNKKRDTVNIGPGHLDYGGLNSDILLLQVLNAGFSVYVLTPSFTLPKTGDKLYLIGCPYSQENCKQNMYELVYKEFDESTSQLIYTTKSAIELAGFSGAPIVDAKGNVVSILTNGWEEKNTKFVSGTFISEIEKIK